MKYWCKINDATILWLGSNSLMLLSFFILLFPYEKCDALYSNRIKYHNNFGIHKKKVSFFSVAAHNFVWVASKTVTEIQFILWTSMNIKRALKVLEVSKRKYTYFFFIKLKPSLEPLYLKTQTKRIQNKRTIQMRTDICCQNDYNHRSYGMVTRFYLSFWVLLNGHSPCLDW